MALTSYRFEQSWNRPPEINQPTLDLAQELRAAGMSKPIPGIFRMAAERIDVPIPSCFFIDDRIDYLAGAIEVGMPYHHFQGDHDALRTDLRAVGYPV